MSSSSSSSNEHERTPSPNLVESGDENDLFLDPDNGVEISLPSVPEGAAAKRAKKRVWFVTDFSNSKVRIQEWFEQNKERFTRFAACEDVAPTTGKYHIHIACIMKNPVPITWWQTFLGAGNHYRWANQKDWERIMNYVLGKGKNDEKNKVKKPFIEFNCTALKHIKGGTRAEFYRQFVQNPTTATMLQLFDKPEFAQCITEIDHCKKYIQLKNSTTQLRDKKRNVIWIWGYTGKGKSLLARKFFIQYQDRVGKPCRNMTLSNTAAQAGGLHGDEGCVLIDDIKLDKIQNQDLLNLADQYPMTIDTKGSTVHYNPDYLFITCTMAPEDIPQSIPKWLPDINQLKRRVTLTIFADSHEAHIDGRWYQSQNQWYTEEEILGLLWTLQ